MATWPSLDLQRPDRLLLRPTLVLGRPFDIRIVRQHLRLLFRIQPQRLLGVIQFVFIDDQPWPYS